MLTKDFFSHNSSLLENLFEHRFIFDMQRELLLRDEPLLLNVLKSEVDAFGFDLVLAVGSLIYHVQMKTISGTTKSHNVKESLWGLQNPCVIWLRYDPTDLEPISYNLKLLHSSLYTDFRQSTIGFGEDQCIKLGSRRLEANKADHKDKTLPELAKILFP